MDIGIGGIYTGDDAGKVTRDEHPSIENRGIAEQNQVVTIFVAARIFLQRRRDCRSGWSGFFIVEGGGSSAGLHVLRAIGDAFGAHAGECQ